MAVETYAELLARAEAIRDETVLKGITKEEVAQLFINLLDRLMPNTGIGKPMLIIKFDYDASDGQYPHGVTGTGLAGIVEQGNIVRIATPSPPDGNQDIKFQVGNKFMALIDSPGNNDADWEPMRG